MKKYNTRICLLLILLGLTMAASAYTSNITADAGYNLKQGYKTGIILDVEPPYNTISPGGITSYSVEVSSLGPPNGLPYPAVGVIHLAIKGLPENAVGVFTPSMGLPNFESKLTIITEEDVKPGLYKLTIFAFNKKNRILEKTEVALSIGGVTVTATGTATVTVTQTGTTATETPTPPTGLEIAFSTDKLSYNPGEQVAVEGIVTDRSGNSIEGASISIQVDNPSGSIVHVYQTATDEQGSFNDTFTLPDDAPNGVYTIFVSATHLGCHGASHSTFTVGESNVPAASILSLNITAANGAEVASFEPGMEAVASIQVLNQGVDLENGIIWLEVDDPRDVPIYIALLSTRLSRGENVTVKFHIFLEEDAVEGVYTANAYVSDDYISKGGTFLDKEKEIFIVEKPSTNITTTTTTTTTNTQFTNTTQLTNTTSIYTTSTLTWTGTNSTTTTAIVTNSTETTASTPTNME